MKIDNYDSLSLAINNLSNKGYTEDFKALETCIKGLYSNNEYSPEDLKIVASQRFDGADGSGDQSELFVVEAKDGTKGTLTLNYSADEDQNADLIKKIKIIK